MGRIVGRWQGLGLAFALVAWVAVLRLPYLHAAPIDGDEALFWLIGRDWLQGRPPYTAIWDVKPPGLFLLYAGAAGLGEPLVGPKLLEIVAVVLTGFALYRFGARQLKSRTAGAAAALLYAPYTLLMGGLAGKPELFMAPLVAAACGLVLEAGAGAAFMAGLMFGAAGMLKQTAAFEAAFAFGWLAWSTRDARRCGLFVLGCAAAPLAFVLYFAAHGLLPEMLRASLLSAAQRLGGDGVGWVEAPLRFLGLLKPMLPLVAGAGLLWVERRRLSAEATTPGLRFLAGWTLAAAAGALAMRATYAAYVMTLLAPLALATGGFLALGAERLAPRAPRWLFLAASLAAALYPVVFFRAGQEAALARNPAPATVAAFLKARLRPGETAYVVDHEPAIYALAGLSPPTRYVLPQHLVCPFAAAGIDPRREIARIMASHPRCLVVSASRRRMACEDPVIGALPLSLGGSDYRLAGRFGGGFDPVEVHCRP